VKPLRKLENGGGLAGAKKSADHDVPCFSHRVLLPGHGGFSA
jgi:hypothetical protein